MRLARELTGNAFVRVSVQRRKDPLARLKGFKGFRQCQDLWCWAAVLQSLLYFLDGDQRSQCALVMKERNEKNCRCGERNSICDRSASTDCNQSHMLIKSLGSLIGSVKPLVPNALSLQVLLDELGANRPVVGRLRLGGSFHYVIFSGVVENYVDGQKRISLEIFDPWDGHLVAPWIKGKLAYPGKWMLKQAFLIPRQGRLREPPQDTADLQGGNATGPQSSPGELKTEGGMPS